MRKFIIMAIVLSLIIISCRAKDKNKYVSKVDSLGLIAINNSNIYPILDSIIMHEKGCDYYSPDLIFSIFIDSRNCNLIIGSVGSKVYKKKNILGCFEYGKHLFVVKGTILDSSLFRKLKQNRIVSFAKSTKTYDKKDDVLIINSEDIQDDSYSYWYYLYKNDTFTLLSSHYCGKE